MDAIVPLLLAGTTLIGVLSAEGSGSDFRLNGKSSGEMFRDARVAALADSACEGDARKVEQAIARGANPNGRGEQGITPLYWAEACGNLVGVEALLNAGADPNQRLDYSGGITAVVAAAWSEKPQLLKLMLKYHGDPNAAAWDYSKSAIECAFDYGGLTGAWDNYYTFLHGGVDINREYDGKTLANYLLFSGAYDKLVELLAHGYDHDLEGLARQYQQLNRIQRIPNPQDMWRKKVKEMLESRGITFLSQGDRRLRIR